MDSANSAIESIDDAISVLAQKAETESRLAAEHERIERAAAAAKLEAQVAAIDAALPKYLEQSRVFSEALSRISHQHFESLDRLSGKC